MYFDDDFSFFFLFGINLFLEYNPILSVLSLIMIYINSTSILSILNYEYVSAILLLIYIGAISILILFIIMMYQINETEMDHPYNKYILDKTLIYSLSGVIFIGNIIDNTILHYYHYTQYISENIVKNQYLFNMQSESFSKSLDTFSNITTISDILYTYYMYPLIISAFFLFFVVIISINLILKHVG